MSEYQYYEFRAVDRPLDDAEMRALRSLSTRADITPTSFANTYNWGDFKGNPRKLVEKYFDAFVYVANWGTHQLMLRLPRELVDVKFASQYKVSCDDVEDSLTVRRSGAHAIIDFYSRDDSSGWEEGEPWMPALITAREHLLSGDMRALYIGWLACVSAGDMDDDDVEPPVPPGLGSLDSPLQALAEFLRVDSDLLTVAARKSIGSVPGGPSDGDIREWIESLPEGARVDLLMQVATGAPAHARAELLRRFRASRGRRAASSAEVGDPDRRTVRQLLDAAEAIAACRRKRAMAITAKEETRRQREEADARKKSLDRLAKREDAAWRDVEGFIAVRKPDGYDRAVALLQDLKEIAKKKGTSRAAASRIRQLRRAHQRKSTFINRLDATGL